MSSVIQGSMADIVAQGMSHVASSGDSFNTGGTTAAFSLYEAFAIAAQKDARIDVLQALYASGITCPEFDAAVKQAIGHAATADKQAGFVAPDGAKGRDKYGPKQSAMVQRASEMRQIFGYFVQAQQVQPMGYLETLKTAREWLKERGIQWDGSTAPTKEEKQEKAQTQALADATKHAMLSVPKVQGESTGEWFERVAQEAQAIVDKQADEAAGKRATKAAQNIVDNFDMLDAYSIGRALIRAAIEAGTVTKDLAVADVAAIAIEEQAPF